MRVATTCKTCRRLGVSVCGREKCALKRKPYPPGIHGKAFRRGLSEFGQQLREKQKVRILYGLRERQFKNLVTSALRQKTMGAPEAVLLSLEMRLDNIVHRIGFSKTRAAARQLVNHGHVVVNNRRVTIPSYRVKMGDSIAIRSQSAGKGVFVNLDITLKKQIFPSWISFDIPARVATITAYPPADALGELGKGFNVNAIVEYYSR